MDPNKHIVAGLIFMEENTMVEEGVMATTDRVYELAVLLVPTLEGDAVTEKFQAIKKYVVEKGAEMVSEDTPRALELQYEMSRTIQNKKTWFEEAHFFWIKFEVDPAVIKVIHDDLTRDEQVIRFMCVKTVKENTIASKKPLGSTRTRKEGGVHGEEATTAETVEETASVEEVDAAVDALVVEA